jgi:(p)ppGpp synthase/HD superfamily hydrolase
VLEVSWGQTDSASYPVDLQLRALDRSGLISDISLGIPDLPTLSTVIAKLEALPNVVSARRRT